MMMGTGQRRRRQRQRPLLLVVARALVLALLLVFPTRARGWRIVVSVPRPPALAAAARGRLRDGGGVRRLVLLALSSDDDQQQQQQQPERRQALVVAQQQGSGGGRQQQQAVGVGPLLRSHAALMRMLCPSVARCRVYLPSELLILDPPVPPEEEQGEAAAAEEEEEEDWRLDEAGLGRYLATCEPLSGGLGGGALLARPPDDSPTALLAPLGADGWISVELLPLLTDDDNDDEEEEKERLRRLAPALDCLRAALALAGKERAEGARARRRLRGLLREIRQPLGALRTFGKLLLRRLEKTDAEGLNQELTSNVLASSDALVAALHRHEHEQAQAQQGEGPEDSLEGVGMDSSSSSSSSALAAPRGEQAGTRRAAVAARDPRAVLTPVVAAAKAISRRDGVRFGCYVEENLPRVAIEDERGFQEALGAMVELALASSLAAAASAEEEEQGAAAAGPAVSLEVARSRRRRPDDDDESVQFVVRDNGLGDTAVGRGGKELGRVRTALERQGMRLEIRRSVSLGGTHFAVSVDALGD